MISEVTKKELSENQLVRCNDVTCSMCGLSCDDIEIELDGKDIRTKKAVERIMDMPVISLEISPGPQAFVSDIILPGVMVAWNAKGHFIGWITSPFTRRALRRHHLISQGLTRIR